MPPKVLCVVGPTACGKTTLGVLLARRLGGEIVSCDSMQIYRGMEIGTAAPTMEERQGIAHHMVGIADPAESYSAARFAREARQCTDGILRRGKLPIFVGGTGLYLDAVLAGHEFARGCAGGAVRERLQRQLEQEGVEPLLARLREVDPASAERLHPSDRKRIVRALEVFEETGIPQSVHHANSQVVPPRYEASYIGLRFADREEMKRRIDRRVDAMVERGLLEEVRTLLRSGVPPTATSLQAIGFKEFLAVAEGSLSEREAIELVKLRSRQYAKRQLSWLRRNESIFWIEWAEEQDFSRALQIATDYAIAQGLG